MLPEIGWILFALLLFVLCAVLLVLEIFIPSLGLIAIISLLMLAWGIYIFFQISNTVGWIGCGSALLIVPAVWIITYKFFPHTRLGRLMVLHKVERQFGDAIPDRGDLQKLQDRQGVALGPLRPVGICEIDGRRVACLSESGYIEKKSDVKVIRVEGHKVTVQKINHQDKRV